MAERSKNALDRSAASAALLEGLAPDALVLASLGSPNSDVAGSGDRPLNFYLRGAMGCAASVALGLALAQPQRRVVAFLGDAEVMMTAGALATIGVMRPQNLGMIIVDNESYGETGMQMSHTSFGIDIAKIAEGSGIAKTGTIRTAAQLKAAATDLHKAPGPVLYVLKVKAEKPGRVRIPYDGVYLKNRFREALLGRDGII